MIQFFEKSKYESIDNYQERLNRYIKEIEGKYEIADMKFLSQMENMYCVIIVKTKNTEK